MLYSFSEARNVVEVEDLVKGSVFQDKNFAKDWETVYVYPSDLEQGVVTKGMRKITAPTLVLASHSSKMAYILASEEQPVFVCPNSMRDEKNGYILLLGLKPTVLPEYIYYLGKYENMPWWNISTSESDSVTWKAVGTIWGGPDGFGGYDVSCITAESVFLDLMRENSFFVATIPELSVQQQRIADAKFMEKMLQERMVEKERKFQQKEWLNETHIRNSKHRLSGEVCPMRIAVERLEKFFVDSPEGVKLSSVIGKATQQTVGGLLINLKTSIRNIEKEIENLTQNEIVGEDTEVIDVAQFIREYLRNVSSKYNRYFVIDINSKREDLKIRISRKSFMELLDNIILNAVRHGFTDDKRDDYKIIITISESNKGCCKIDIANNGNPISERGSKEYFVRGSFAGKTGHTGIGGARVKEICEDANGTAFEPHNTEEYLVVVEVEFPIVSL